MVMFVGIQLKAFCTSARGFTLVETMVYSGSSVKTDSTVSRMTRKVLKDRDSCIFGHPIHGLGDDPGGDPQEDQQQGGHGGAEPEVPVHERAAVDVDRGNVRRSRWGGA